MGREAREEGPPADYESTPITRGEYIAALVHLYRGELYRATAWRLRLDTTTNWAVLTTAGLVSLSFSEDTLSHWVPLLGLAVVTVFWAFESRRFRHADVWHVRVRKIEENFYGPILRRDPVSPEAGWGNLVAEDLFLPSFKISRLYALRARLLRNYWAIYLVLVLAWGIKVFVHPEPVDSWVQVRERLGGGLLPWWLPVMWVGALAVLLSTLALLHPWFSGPDHEHGEMRGTP